jgi:hypothetical protein
MIAGNKPEEIQMVFWVVAPCVNLKKPSTTGKSLIIRFLGWCIIESFPYVERWLPSGL